MEATGAARFAPRVLPVETLDFRSALVWVGRFRCPAGHPLFADSGPASAHLFVFPRTSVRIRHAGREAFVASPNIATFYNPGDEYRRTAISAEGDHCDWFAVAPELAADAIREVDPRAAERPERAFRFTHGPSAAAVYLEQRLTVQEAASGRTDALCVEETAVRLLARLVRDAYATRGAGQECDVTRAADRELAEAARALLAGRFAEGLSLAQVAAAVGCPVFRLCRAFRRATGRSLHEYRQQLRLRRSLAELADSPADDITGIALGLGFSSHSHFTYAFRRAFGLTPAAFRRAAHAFAARRRPDQPDLDHEPARE